MTKLSFTKNRKEFYTIAALVFLAIAIPLTVYALLSNRDQRGRAAGNATISLSPATQNVNQNANFTVSIFENSGTEQVSGVQANLSYDINKLDFVSIDNTGSLFGDLGSSLPDSVSGGQIKMTRIIPGGNAPVTGNQLVTKVTFKAKQSPGSTPITFAAGTTIGKVDSTDILGTINNGTYTIVDPPPSVSLTAPTAGSIVRGATVGLTANATDDVGVTKVEFYDGANLISSDSTAPTYTATWNTTTGNVANGNHTLTAKAFDANGSTTSAPSVVVVDNAPPTVSLTNPGSPLKGQVIVSATASDNVAIAKVEFFVDGSATPKGTDTTSPTFSFSWDTTTETNASHTLTAKATDTAGNPATSSGVSVTVDNQSPSAPTGLTTTGTSTTSITLNWTASTDSQTGISGYDVYRNGSKIASPTTTSYSDTGLTPNTTYTYHVIAKDGAGNNSAPSATVNGETQSQADLTGDGKVNVLDLIYVTQRWLTTNSTADLNNDGVVNILDLIFITTRWAP